MRSLALLLVLVSSIEGAGCDALAKTPRGEVMLVVDTDLPVPKLVGTLRVDVFREDPGPRGWAGLVWTATNEFRLEEKRDWPASFGVALDETAESTRFWVRLRLYRTGRTRDYVGERFLERPTGDGAPGDLFVAPATDTDEPRYVDAEVDKTPAVEPSPSLTVDRLVTFQLREGDRKTGTVRLLGDCAGVQADLAGRRTCIDSALVAVEELSTTTSSAAVPRSDTWVGRWRTV